MSNTVVRGIALAVQARQPILAWGAPGVGKSTGISAIGRKLDYHTEVVIGSIREPSDIAGWPIVKDGELCLAAPKWAHNLTENTKGGLLFLDEITTAPPAVQAALLRVVLDRVVGDFTLPDHVAIVAAANPPDQAASGQELAAPLANRFCHVNWPLDQSAWVDGMLTSFPDPVIPILPDTWKGYMPEASALVAGFIKHKPTSLLIVPKEEDKSGRAWPSPRSWHMGTKLLAACLATKVEADTEILLVTGSVGEGVGMEFFQWKKQLDLPDPEWVLSNPEKWEVPTRADRTFTIIASVVAAVTAKMDRNRYLAAWKVIYQVAQAGMKDVAAAGVLPLARGAAGRSFLTDKEVRTELYTLTKPFGDILAKAGLGKA